MTSPARIALATASEVPDLDAEGQLLADRLRERGLEARAEIWDDDSVVWEDFDLVVIRSTWDYPTRRAEFVAWAEEVERRTRLANPARLIRWTTDKRYLQDLAEAGVPIVESVFLAADQGSEHPFLHVEHVVKPSASAGSKDTHRISAGRPERSRECVEAIQRSGRTALIQPYLPAVDVEGETALIYLDGQFSHAIRKGAILRADAAAVEGLYAEEEIESRVPSQAELTVGSRALAAVPGAEGTPPLYARVDLLPLSGSPVVLEVELAEPSLFLEHHPQGASPLAEAIRRRLE